MLAKNKKRLFELLKECLGGDCLWFSVDDSAKVPTWVLNALGRRFVLECHKGLTGHAPDSPQAQEILNLIEI